MAGALPAEETRDRLPPAQASCRSIDNLCMRSGAMAETGRMWLKFIGSKPALVLADENTMGAAGHEAASSLEASNIDYRVELLSNPQPESEIGDAIASNTHASEHILAIGSGVVNDLAKYAAHQLRRPYVCVATAASMDGYTSPGAPLSAHGFKITIPCTPPAAVIGDLNVISKAPPHLTSSGYGDLAGKCPAGADWILADGLGIESIEHHAFDLVQGGLAKTLGDFSAVGAGERQATANLFKALLQCGYAMDDYGSSRPASGADHQIAHLWEMEKLTHQGNKVGHGFCVAIGCMAVLRLYEWLLERNPAAQDTESVISRAPGMEEKASEIRTAFKDREIAERAEEETRSKHLGVEMHRERLATIARNWPGIKAPAVPPSHSQQPHAYNAFWRRRAC